ELVLREGAPNAAMAAEKYFLLSLDWARRQQTLSWELRTATSMARLRRDQHRIEEARDLLSAIYARFTEGFEPVDRTTAKALVALDKGYFRVEGLDVTIDTGSAPEAINRLAAETYDMAFTDINLLIKFRDQNPQFRINTVFMTYNKPAYAIVSRKSRGVTTPK